MTERNTDIENVEDIRSVIHQLRAEHSLYDSHIDDLNRRVYLSMRERAELSRLKKLKLAIKDRLSHIENR
jgi:hypothetical protein